MYVAYACDACMHDILTKLYVCMRNINSKIYVCMHDAMAARMRDVNVCMHEWLHACAI